MTTKELRNNIEKVLGNSIRCLLPSYWWKRLFNQVADTIDEVAESIDNINDIKVVKSASSLNGLDVPSGSVASVYNERKFKFSECYKPTAEDAKLPDDELFAKLTQIKAINVNNPLPETLDKDVVYTLMDYIGKNEQGGIDSGICYIGYVRDYGWCAIGFYNYEEDINIFLLNRSYDAERFNEYLSQRNFRYTFDDEDVTDEDYSILESIFSVVEADTNVYVKGTSWEKLAKEGDSGESNIVINKGVKDVTYAELVNLVITRKLVTGTNYRITDYELKINSDWMRVDERKRWYKIIVTATSNSTLDENAVIEYEHENLLIHGAVHLYKIKYSVFNDDTKYPIANPKYIVVKYGEQTMKLYYMYTQGGSFGEYKYMWSPNPYLEAILWNFFSTTENPSVGDVVYNAIDQEYIEITEVVNGDGKGVIYYMEDERGNAAPFDFKNVQFKVYSFSDGYSFVDITGKNNVEWIYAFDGLFADRYISYNGGTYHIPKDYSQVGSIYEGNEIQGGRKLVVYPCVNNKLFGYNILEAAPQKIEGGWKFTMANNTIYGNKNIVFVNNNCIVNDSCNNIVISGSTNNAGEISNVEVLGGVSGEDGSVLVIETPISASADTKTYIGRDSSGNIKTFNVADENVGGGDDILRVMIPDVNILEFACEALGRRPIINMTEMSEVLRFLDDLFSLAHNKEVTIWADNYTPVLEEMFAHNALIYAKIKEKAVNKEPIQVMWDGSKSYSITLSIINSISGGAYNDISWENITLSGYAIAAAYETEEFVGIIPLAQEANAIGIPWTFIPNVNFSLSASGEFVLEDTIDTVLYTFDDAGFQVSENIKTLEKGSIHNVTLYERPGYKFQYPIIDSSYEEGFGFKGKYIKDNNICQIAIPADTGIPKVTILNKIDKEDVLRVYASNYVKSISKDNLSVGEDASEEEIAYYENFFNTNANTYAKILEHYNSIFTFSGIGMPSVIIDYSYFDSLIGDENIVFSSTPASVNITNINSKLVVSIVPQYDFKPLGANDAIPMPFLLGYNLSEDGSIEKIEGDVIFIGSGFELTSEILQEYNNNTKIAFQYGLVDASKIKIISILNQSGLKYLEETLPIMDIKTVLMGMDSYFASTNAIAGISNQGLFKLHYIDNNGAIATIDLS